MRGRTLAYLRTAGDSTATGPRRNPVADVGSARFGIERVDRDHAHRPDIGNRAHRTGAVLARACGDELDCVVAKVGTGDDCPALDLGILAGGGDPVDVGVDEWVEPYSDVVDTLFGHGVEATTLRRWGGTVCAWM